MQKGAAPAASGLDRFLAELEKKKKASVGSWTPRHQGAKYVMLQRNGAALRMAAQEQPGCQATLCKRCRCKISEVQYAQYAPFDHHALLPLQVNILDKSKMDWNQLKSADANMEEELEAHKRSNKKYLDKVSVAATCRTCNMPASALGYNFIQACAQLVFLWRIVVPSQSATLQNDRGWCCA